MPRSTPWGAAQHVETLFRGCAAVSTAGHGGLMVAPATAAKLLSRAARKEALIHAGYLCFEQDCAVTVAVYDSPAIRAALYDEERLVAAGGEDALIKSMHLSLSTYYVDYLEAIGVAPDPEKRKTHDARKAFEEARREAPETVFVACKGEWATMIEGVHLIYDGAGNSHYVTAASLNALRKCPEAWIRSKLADLELLDAETLPPACERLVPYLDFCRGGHESNGMMDRFDKSVEYIKSQWIELVNKEHEWSEDKARAFIERNEEAIRGAVRGPGEKDALDKSS